MSTAKKYSNMKKSSMMDAIKKSKARFGKQTPFVKSLFNPSVNKNPNDNKDDEQRHDPDKLVKHFDSNRGGQTK